ncbi:MAG: hypothetical protein KF878_03380 [Planctomycetes bacterium]|nr:hypothetical protein [Planctomycetota bacterium]
MKGFVADVVTRLGGEARDEDGVLAVRLPAEGPGDELARRLGQHELRLVFEPTRIGPGVDLVAPGSHVLRELEDFLSGRARRAWVEAPAQHKLTLKALSGVVRPAKGAALALEGRAAAAGHDVHVVYRVRYRSLDRCDEVETVRVRLRPLAEPEVSLAEPPDEVVDWEARPRKHLPAEELEAALALADEAVVTRARAEGARREDEGRRKASRELSRLHAYYAGQIADLERSRRTEQALTRIEELEDERALRLHELATTTHVRVEVEPLQLLVVEVPLATARLVVRRRGEAPDDGDEAAPAPSDDTAPPPNLVLDRLEGTLLLPPCPACEGALAGQTVDGCASGHLVHQRCLDRCGRCERFACAACGARACAACGQATCPGCATACPACERSVCADHTGACAICGKAACAVCLRACAECGVTVCETDGHLAAEGSRAVLCTRCAVPCPGCKTATSYKELVRCATCGRKFCPTCHPRSAAACVLCGPT